MSSSSAFPPEAEAPDEGAHGEETAAPAADAMERAPRHRLRWVFLCVAAAAVVASSFLLLQLELGMPLSFANTVLLTLAVAVALPVLLVALLGKRLSERGFSYQGQFILVCLMLAVAFAALGLS